MRYTGKFVVLAYSAFLAVLVYWVLDQQLLYGSDVANWAVLVLLIAVHLALGYAVGHAWALPLPLLAVVMALPLGYPSANKGEPLPIWLGLLFFVPAAIALVAIGSGRAGSMTGARCDPRCARRDRPRHVRAAHADCGGR